MIHAFQIFFGFMADLSYNEKRDPDFVSYRVYSCPKNKIPESFVSVHPHDQQIDILAPYYPDNFQCRISKPHLDIGFIT